MDVEREQGVAMGGLWLCNAKSGRGRKTQDFKTQAPNPGRLWGGSNLGCSAKFVRSEESLGRATRGASAGSFAVRKPWAMLWGGLLCPVGVGRGEERIPKNRMKM